MSLLWLFAHGVLAAELPALITYDPAGQEACPVDVPLQLHAKLKERLPKPQRAGALTVYERAVAEWAVCARIHRLEVWGVPPLGDPAARAVAAANLAPPGSRIRVEGLGLAVNDLPAAVAVLALEDLGTMRSVALGEPALRAGLAAASIGAWGCPDAVEWIPGPGNEPLGVCTNAENLDQMALAGLQRLYDLTPPLADRSSWLLEAVRPWIDQTWAEVAEVWVPLSSVRPEGLATGGIGNPLEAGTGWVWVVNSDATVWRQRPAVRATRDGIEPIDTSPGTSSPPDAESPLVHVAPDVTLGHLDEVLGGWNALRPTFSAMGATGPVEMRLLWSRVAPGSNEVVPIDTLDVVELIRLRQDLGQDGPIWLAADPSATWGQLVAAVTALAGIREPPIVFSVVR